MSYPCFQALHLAISGVSVDACASARATIRAAEVQAKAARYAAWIGAGSGLLGSVVAIAAAIIAYLAATVEPRRQAALEKDRRIFFARHINNILSNCLTELSAIESYLSLVYSSCSSNTVTSFAPPKPTFDVTSIDVVAKTVSLSNWHELALLPSSATASVLKVGLDLNRLITDFVEIREKGNRIREDFNGGESATLNATARREHKEFAEFVRTLIQSPIDLQQSIMRLIGEIDTRLHVHARHTSVGRLIRLYNKLRPGRVK